MVAQTQKTGVQFKFACDNTGVQFNLFAITNDTLRASDSPCTARNARLQVLYGALWLDVVTQRVVSVKGRQREMRGRSVEEREQDISVYVCQRGGR